MKQLAEKIKRLAHTKQLNDHRESIALIQDVNRFLDQERNIKRDFVAIDLTWFIHNLGKIAHASRYEISSTALNQLITGLCSYSHFNNEMIHRTFIGLSFMTQNNTISGRLHSKKLNELLTVFLKNSEISSNNIAYIVYILNQLACGNYLTSPLDPRTLNNLLKIFASSELIAKDISKVIYSLNGIAKSGFLTARIDQACIGSLTQKLLTSHPDAISLSHVIYGLGGLAKDGYLSSTIDSAYLNELLKMLDNLEFDEKSIGLSIRGLGWLAKNHYLTSGIDAATLHSLLSKTLNSHPNNQSIYQLIEGLSRLTEHDALIGELDVLHIQQLLNAMELQHSDKQSLRNLLEFLVNLRYVDNLTNPVLPNIFQKLVDGSYLHQGSVINVLVYYSKLLAFNALDDQLFEFLISKLTLPFAQYSESQKEELNKILQKLPTDKKENLSIKLGLMPAKTTVKSITIVSSTEKPRSWTDTCNKNQIFQKIANQDINGLMKLLGIKAPTPKSASYKSHVRSFSYFSVSNQQHTAVTDSRDKDEKNQADAMVTQFLRSSEPEALKYLIENSRYDFFEIVLRACSKHNQYQLAINGHLHAIILYLSAPELDKMVSSLIHLGFYQDHRAVIRIIEALFIRKTSHPQSIEDITNLQKKLLDKAIQFHEQHHKHVTEKLTDFAASQQLRNCLDNITKDNAEVLLGAPSFDNHDAPKQAAFSNHMQTFVEEPLMLVDKRPNMLAYYSAETVFALLSLKLASTSKDIKILAPLDYHQVPDGAIIRNQLLEYLAEEHEGIQKDTIFCFPICISNHWVCINLELNEHPGKLKLTYFDSSNTPTYENIVMQAAVAAFKEVYQTHDIHTVNATYYHQEDGFSCGAYMIENMIKHVFNAIPRRNVNAESLRMQHLDLLELDRNDYYQKHLAMAIQQRKHGLNHDESENCPSKRIKFH